MNQEAQAYLESILAKHISALTEEDISFLKARRSYLSPAQVAELAPVFGQEEAPKKTSKKKSEE